MCSNFQDLRVQFKFNNIFKIHFVTNTWQFPTMEIFQTPFPWEMWPENHSQNTETSTICGASWQWSSCGGQMGTGHCPLLTASWCSHGFSFPGHSLDTRRHAFPWHGQTLVHYCPSPMRITEFDDSKVTWVFKVIDLLTTWPFYSHSIVTVRLFIVFIVLLSSLLSPLTPLHCL